MDEGQFDTIYINKADTNLAGIMDPEKGTGIVALSAKDTEDDYEIESETQVLNQIFAKCKKFKSLEVALKMAAGGVAVNKENSHLQLLRQIPISIQIITAGKTFPQWAGV